MTPRRLVLGAAASAIGLVVLAGCSATSTVESGADDTLAELEPGAKSAATLDEETAGVVDQEVAVVDGVDIEQIVMIGDSITVGAMAPLEERFAALGYPEAVIEAQSGKRINVAGGDNPSGTAVAAGLVDARRSAGDTDHSDELWVVALGSNDVNQYSTSDELGAAIDSLLAEVPAEAELIWVDTAYVGQSEGTDIVNATIADRIEARGDATIASWSSVAYRDGVLSADGLHPTDIGSDVFAATVVATAAEALVAR